MQRKHPIEHHMHPHTSYLQGQFKSLRAKDCLIAKTKSLDEIAFQALKGRFITLKDFAFIFSTDAPKNHMRKTMGIFFFTFLPKKSLPSKKMVRNGIRNNPRIAKQLRASSQSALAN